ncbi:MAG: hypothetical protein D6698_16595 [Gammaproteobacteria bacterium]|nr:MAG: hypothetical protein D6698_16595 [Gammaproteobacteria bacterium]
MREDIHHLLVDAGRARWTYKEKRGKRKKSKSPQRDHITPLIRFLHSRTGQPWSKVHGEISSRYRGRRNLHSNHVWDHVWGLVEEKPLSYDPPYHSNGYPLFYPNLYVDQHGILRSAPRYKYPPKKQDSDLFRRDGKVYLRIEGIWYCMGQEEEVEREWRGHCYRLSIFRLRPRHQTWIEAARAKVWSPRSKRQLSKKELKALNLR